MKPEGFAKPLCDGEDVKNGRSFHTTDIDPLLGQRQRLRCGKWRALGAVPGGISLSVAAAARMPIRLQFDGARIGESGFTPLHLDCARRHRGRL